MLPVLLLAVFFAQVSAQRPLEAVADAKEGWLQVCCQVNDLDDNGAITFREFTPFVLNVLDVNRKELERIFLTADEDKNSDLDGSECPVVRKMLRERMADKVRLAIKNYDVNHDGRLSQDEARPLAQKEFGIDREKADSVFWSVDPSHEGSIGHIHVTDLLLELRTAAIAKAGGRVTTWDRNQNKLVSYDEMKAAMMSTDAANLKAAFKRIDYDKDLHLSGAEYLALLRELEQQKTKLRVRRHARGQFNRVREEVIDQEPSLKEKRVLSNARVPHQQSRFVQRRGFPRFRRSEAETAPPPLDVTTEIAHEKAQEISSKVLHNMSGGHRAPSMDDAIIVPIDDPDFQ